MCGIIYAKNLTGNESVNNLIKMLYQNQKSRGQQGFGFVGMNSKSIDTYRAINEKEILGHLNAKPYSELLFHHRYPTSTRNTIKSTHPFVVRLNRKKYYFVHNGIVQNDTELQECHIKRKITYNSQEEGLFNDSEALAWDFCLWLNGKQAKMQAKGTMAFICLETDEKNKALKLYFYRNAEVPLKVYRDDVLLVVSSEGNYPSLKENCLCCWDYESRNVLKVAELKIDCPPLYDVYMDDEDFDDDILYAELQELRHERDYLISVGSYDEADYIQEQITDLSYQIKGRTLTPF